MNNTFLVFSDVSGFGKLEKEDYQTRLTRLDDLLSRSAQVHHGWINASGGDTYLAGFQNGDEAIGFVQDISNTTATDVTIPSLHTGLHFWPEPITKSEVAAVKGNLRHPAINYVARLNAMAVKNEVLISSQGWKQLGSLRPPAISIQIQGIKEIKDPQTVFVWEPALWDAQLDLHKYAKYYCLCALLDCIEANGTWGKSLPKAISILQDNKERENWAVADEGSVTFTAFAYFFLRSAGIRIPEEICRETDSFLRSITKASGIISPKGGGDPSADELEKFIRHHITGLWAFAELLPFSKPIRQEEILGIINTGLGWLLDNKRLILATEKYRHTFAYTVLCFSRLKEELKGLHSTFIGDLSDLSEKLYFALFADLQERRFVNSSSCPKTKTFWTLVAYYLLARAVSQDETLAKNRASLLTQAESFVKTSIFETPSGVAISLAGESSTENMGFYAEPSPTTMALAFHLYAEHLQFYSRTPETKGDCGERTAQAARWAKQAMQNGMGYQHNTIHSWVLLLEMITKLGVQIAPDCFREMIALAREKNLNVLVEGFGDRLPPDGKARLLQEFMPYYRMEQCRHAL